MLCCNCGKHIKAAEQVTGHVSVMGQAYPCHFHSSCPKKANHPPPGVDPTWREEDFESMERQVKDQLRNDPVIGKLLKGGVDSK